MGQKIVYTYDTGGNITSKKIYAYTNGTVGNLIDTINYTYNTTWKDKLASYDGQTITYDSIGNPKTYRDGMSFTWNGRQLVSYTKGDLTVTYKYDENGLRTQKTVNGVNYNYVYENGLLVYEEKKGEYELVYRYDADGSLFTVNRYRYSDGRSDLLYAVHNTRGDLIELRTGSGSVNNRYSYDSWGRLVSVTNSSGTELAPTTVGVQNSVRYRGYIYDTETGLYYLQSRYYDPETGRFLNADDVDYIGYSGEDISYNAFAYCENNAVNGLDHTGYTHLAFSLYSGYDDKNGYAFLFTALNDSAIINFKVTQNANFALLRVYKNNVKITICLSNSVKENKKYLLGFAKYDWVALLASQVFDVYERVYKKSFYEKRSHKGVVLEIALHMYMYFFDIDKEYNYKSSKDIDIDTNGNGKYFEYKAVLKQANKLTDLCLKAIKKGKKNLFVNTALKAYVKWSNRNK